MLCTACSSSSSSGASLGGGRGCGRGGPGRSRQTASSNTELSYGRGRDSGLESDGSEEGEEGGGGLYDKLPPYLTSVTTQVINNSIGAVEDCCRA